MRNRSHVDIKKKKLFEQESPSIDNISEANLFIRELWQKLREYEDRLTLSSRNSSKSPSSDSPADKAERKKAQMPRSGNKVGAQPGHTGHKRPLVELSKIDEQVACLPNSCCADCGGKVIANSSVSYRHQVF